MRDPFNAAELHKHLTSSGLSILGCNSRGKITWKNTPTPEELSLSESIKERLLEKGPAPDGVLQAIPRPQVAVDAILNGTATLEHCCMLFKYLIETGRI